MSTMENNATAAVMRLIQVIPNNLLNNISDLLRARIKLHHMWKSQKSQKLLGLIAWRTSISGGNFVAVYSAVKILEPGPKCLTEEQIFLLVMKDWI